jgi:superfamily II DNA or RNA helicase
MRIKVEQNIKIKQDEIKDSLYNWIQRNLCFLNPEYVSALQSGRKHATYGLKKFVYAYRIVSNYMILDRGVLIPITNYCYRNNIEFTIVNKTVSRPHDLVLKGIKLRGYQKRAAKMSLERRGGIIVQPCGGGKTITLLALARELNQHTLILVHTNFLLNQWLQYIKDFLGYDSGVIQGDRIDIKPITVGMIQTLYNRKITKKFAYKWGCIIVDEAHHIPASMFRSVVNKFPAKYRYGATATVNRSDSLTKMIFSILGPISYRISSNRLASLGYISIPTVVTRETLFDSSSNQFQRVMKHLINDNSRNEMIINDLVKNSNRFNLVLSSRIDHLTNLANMYSKHSNDFEVVIGKVKPKIREEIIERMKCGQLHTIFATQLADEGLDIPILDTLYLVFPTKARGRIEQRIGRIQRIAEGKSAPLVYDYVDNWVSFLFRQAQQRLLLYQELELNIINEE